MRFLFITFAISILLQIFSAQAAETFRRPQNLKEGDTIAIISPASLPEKSFIRGAEKVLHQWGYKTVVGEHALIPYGSYAGSPEQREADLLWALRTPSIKAVMCSRGGYGSVQELSRIPLDTLAKYPKWVIGYSDITAIHSALVCSGNMSIHAHMCEYLRDYKGTDSCSIVLRNLLRGKFPEYVIDAHPYNHQGTATGTLVGGNMSVFGGLAGSDIDFLNKKDIILFVEDVSERITSIDRMFHLLKVRGILGRLKGLVIGQFTDYRPDSDYATMYDMISNIVRPYNIPIVFDFPVGHVNKNFPMIEGAQVTLTVNDTTATLTFHE